MYARVVSVAIYRFLRTFAENKSKLSWHVKDINTL